MRNEYELKNSSTYRVSRMSSLIAKKIPPGAQARRDKNKVLYTIHERRSCNPYLVNTFVHSSTMKSSIVGFPNKNDANMFSNILESYRKEHGEWLKLDCENKCSLDLYLRVQSGVNIDDSECETSCPNSLYIEKWDTIQLNNYCMSSLCDLLVMTRTENNSTFKCVIHQVEYNHLHALESFERRFTEQ